MVETALQPQTTGVEDHVFGEGEDALDVQGVELGLVQLKARERDVLAWASLSSSRR